jgi:hypothetical protein
MVRVGRASAVAADKELSPRGEAIDERVERRLDVAAAGGENGVTGE